MNFILVIRKHNAAVLYDHTYYVTLKQCQNTFHHLSPILGLFKAFFLDAKLKTITVTLYIDFQMYSRETCKSLRLYFQLYLNV